MLVKMYRNRNPSALLVGIENGAAAMENGMVVLQTFKNREDLQDGRGVRRKDHLPLHKYIKNTPTCGTTPTEHLLNTGRRPQTSQKARNSPHTWVGQKKKRKKTETKE